MSAAKGVMQQAQAQDPTQGAQAPGQPPVAPQVPQQPINQPQPSGLPVPPPGIALQLAKQAASMPPMVLGTLLWRGLQQHGAATGNLTKHFGGQPAQPMAGAM